MKAVATRGSEATTGIARRSDSRGVSLSAPGPAIQRRAELEIGPADDPLEREADSMAAAVAKPPAASAHRPTAEAGFGMVSHRTVQRSTCAACGSDGGAGCCAPMTAVQPRGMSRPSSMSDLTELEGLEAPTITPSIRSMLRRKCSACEDVDRVRAKRDGSAAAFSGRGFAAPPIVHEVLDSPGQPLDRATRSYFEPRFGRDFSDAQLHTGSAARGGLEPAGASSDLQSESA